MPNKLRELVFKKRWNSREKLAETIEPEIDAHVKNSDTEPPNEQREK
jgi:hypothetical protein